MKSVLKAAIAALALTPSIAAAQAVSECKDFDPDSIIEPWEKNIATYSNGEIRVAALDTIEPAAAAFRFLVLSPPRDEVGGRSCHIITNDDGNGFGAIYFDKRTSSYDAAKGLTVTIPYMPAGAEAEQEASYLRITINQSTGKIETWASHEP